MRLTGTIPWFLRPVFEATIPYLRRLHMIHTDLHVPACDGHSEEKRFQTSTCYTATVTKQAVKRSSPSKRNHSNDSDFDSDEHDPYNAQIQTSNMLSTRKWRPRFLCWAFQSSFPQKMWRRFTSVSLGCSVSHRPIAGFQTMPYHATRFDFLPDNRHGHQTHRQITRTEQSNVRMWYRFSCHRKCQRRYVREGRRFEPGNPWTLSINFCLNVYVLLLVILCDLFILRTLYVLTFDLVLEWFFLFLLSRDVVLLEMRKSSSRDYWLWWCLSHPLTMKESFH